MKLTISKGLLQSALGTCAPAVMSRSTLPVLTMFKLTAEKETNTLSIAAFNMSVGILKIAGCSVTEPGAICVPAKLFTETVSAIEGEITLETTEATMSLKVKAKGFKGEIKGIDAAEFPPEPKITFGKTINGSLINRIGRKSIFATSRDEARPVLQCVNLVSDNGTMKAIASDGFRLSLVSTPCSSDITVCNIPNVAMALVSKMVGNINLNMANPGRLDICTEDLAMNISLVDGLFPDPSQIVPKTFAHKIDFKREDMLRAVKRVQLYAGDSFIVDMTMGDGKIVLSAQTEEAGNGESVIECESAKEPMKLSINGQYLREAIESFDSDTVTIGCNTPKSPVMFSEATDPEYRHIIMPMGK